MKANGKWKIEIGSHQVGIEIANGESDVTVDGHQAGGTCDDLGDLLALLAQQIKTAAAFTHGPTMLVNSFHGTSVRTSKSRGALDSIRNRHPADWSKTERREVMRLRKALCGIEGCTCGGVFGERE